VNNSYCFAQEQKRWAGAEKCSQLDY